MNKLTHSFTKNEYIGGWIYLILQLLILPVLLSVINILTGSPLSDAALNFIFFALNFTCITVIMRRFLTVSLRHALSSPFRLLRAALFGFLLYYVSTFLTGLLITYISPDFSNVNDNSIAIMTQDNYMLMSIGTVLLVPVTEELLYRGLIFQGLYNRNRFAAYVVSTVVFCMIHIAGYIGLYPPSVLFLCFIQYIPAGLCLGWAYAQADSIWAPILMHITINQIGISAMR